MTLVRRIKKLYGSTGYDVVAGVGIVVGGNVVDAKAGKGTKGDYSLCKFLYVMALFAFLVLDGAVHVRAQEEFGGRDAGVVGCREHLETKVLRIGGIFAVKDVVVHFVTVICRDKLWIALEDKVLPCFLSCVQFGDKRGGKGIILCIAQFLSCREGVTVQAVFLYGGDYPVKVGIKRRGFGKGLLVKVYLV